MNHGKKIVVDVLKGYMDLSVEFINEIVVTKLDGFMPDHLKKELTNRILTAAKETTKNNEKILQRYIDDEQDFKNLVYALNENALEANIRGQVIAQKFAVEFDREITEFQLANESKIRAKLKELGMPVPEVEMLPDINTNGGQA